MFYYDGTDEEEYKQMNRTIFDGNVMIMSLIIMEGGYGVIDADDSTRHVYYILNCSLSPYTRSRSLYYQYSSYFLR